MKPNDWLQLSLFVIALVAITKPVGLYLVRVLDANGRTWLDPVLRPVLSASTIGNNTLSPCCCSAS